MANVTGNWRFAVADESPFTGPVSIVQSATTRSIEGHAIDIDGIATLSGTYDATTGAIEFTKFYLDGFSKGDEYVYTGAIESASATFKGSWQGATSSSSWSATLVSGYSPSLAAGTWSMLANWGTGNFELAVTNEGYVTGTMADTVGSSNLDGLLDLGNGTLYFRKVYTSGSTFWYSGNVNAAGTLITNGNWGNASNRLTEGTWTAGR